MINEKDNAYPNISRHSSFLIDDMLDDSAQLYDKYEVAKLIKSLVRDGMDKNYLIKLYRKNPMKFSDELEDIKKSSQ